MELHTLTVVRHTERFEAMSRFYGELLGMSTVETWDRPDGRGAVFAPAGSVSGAHIEVLDMPGATVTGTSPANIVLTLFVADVRAVHDALVSAEAAIARGLEDTSWGHRSIGLDDPDGLRIWIVEELAEA
jgi:catechol 2,3-dioxygenase-like lactoylglutathione lyase family enzyme